MVSKFLRPNRLGVAFFTLVCAYALTGCGVDLSSPTEPLALPGKVIQGHAHGGVYPIQGATIRLMETQSNGYGGAAKALLQTTSDNNGYFTFPDTGWSCDSTQFAYITVTTGHTASNATNNNVAQIGIIGNCGQFLANTGEVDGVQVYVSELSTIAAAYTLRNFITIDNTKAASGGQIINISAPANNNAPAGVCTFTAPTSCVAAGLAHGFQNAYNLVDSVSYNGRLPTGQARTSPPFNPYAYVPQALINTLGNVLQSCVDSPGGSVANYATYSPGGTGSTRCGDLFYWATPPSGTPPTNTLEVALNMAQYPGNHASNLYALQPRAVFFTPTMSSAPTDLSISVFYLTSAFGGSSATLNTPVGLALDANDDAFVLAASGSGAANTQTAVLGISANGAVLFAGPLSTTYLNPSNIAVDALDNIWFTNDSTTNGAVLKASPSTGAISVGTTLASAAGLTVDRFNNVWVATDSTTASSMQEFTNTSLSGGTALASVQTNAIGGGLLNLSIDPAGNIWGLKTSGTTSAAVVLANSGTTGTPSYGHKLSSQSLNSSAGLGGAPNAVGEVYFPLKGQLNDAIYSGGLTTNNLGTFTGTSQDSSTYNIPNQAEVDGAGNVFWTDLEASGKIFQFVPSPSGNMNQGSLYSLLPCYPQNGACYLPAVVNGRGMQIDSTGTLWYMADASFNGSPLGVLIQTFGVGAPTWPQLSLQQPGAKPK